MWRARIDHKYNYNDLDQLVFATVKAEKVIGICPGTLEINKKKMPPYMPPLLIMVATFLFVEFLNLFSFSMQDIEVMEKVLAILKYGDYLNYLELLLIILIPVILLLNGFRYKPDLMVIGTLHLYFFKEILYDKKSKTYSFKEIYKVNIAAIKKGKTITIGAIMIHLTKKYRAKLSPGMFFKKQFFKTDLLINIKQAKKILFG